MKILFVLLILIISEKLCIFLAAFLFGYIFGYNLFEILKYRNKKDEIHEFQVIKKIWLKQLMKLQNR